MNDLLARYPALEPYLDPTAGMEATAQELLLDGQRHLLLTQSAEYEAGQTLFAILDDGEIEPVDSDTIVDIRPTASAGLRPRGVRRLTCGPASAADHAAVDAYQRDQVGRFSTAAGPDGGNLACVWAVRHIVHAKLKRWITRTDGTAVFAPELLDCMDESFDQNDVPAGGIVISPSVTRRNGTRNVGHVGLLGSAGGGGRLIYSNSSRRKLWTQSHTVDEWTAYYGRTKGLKVMFFPLPSP